MKNILCFGDSNTYGYVPETHERYDENSRWTGILQELCGNDYFIIEAGCNNRTAFCNNPVGVMQTGYKILPKFLTDDLDTVILALGINDMQMHYNFTDNDIKTGIENLIKITRETVPEAQILLICPSILTGNVLKSPKFSVMFNEDSIERSKKLGKIYSQIAKNENCKYLDLNTCTVLSDVDGLHYDKEQHKIIAEKIYSILDQRGNNANKKQPSQ